MNIGKPVPSSELVDIFPAPEGSINMYYGLIGNGKTYAATADAIADLENGNVVYTSWRMKWDGDEAAEFENNGPQAERVPEARPTPVAPTPAPEPQNDAQLVQRPASQREIAPVAPAAPAPNPTAARTPGPLQFSLEPSSPKEALAMAAHLYESRLFSNFPNADAIFAIIVAGRSMGIDAMTALRTERDRRLLSCDWTQLPDVPLSQSQVLQWRTYRKALRDTPEAVQAQGWDGAVNWPIPPTS